MGSYKGIALERIDILMEKAIEVFHEDKTRANRYAGIAKRIASRHAMRFPKRWKQSICGGCGCLLVPGSNCKVRTHGGRVIVTCLECTHVEKIPFTKEIKARRRKKNSDGKNGDVI